MTRQPNRYRAFKILPVCRGLAVGLLVATASSAADVKAFPSKRLEVTQYATYQWSAMRVVTGQGIVDDDPQVAPLIKQSVNAQLARRGYTEVSEGGELLLVSAALGSASNQLDGYLVSWGFDYYWGAYSVTAVSPISRVNKAGTLFVCLLDAKTNEAVWSGYVTEALGRPAALPKTINKAANRLIKKVPKRKN